LSLFAEIVRVLFLRTKQFRRGTAFPDGPPARGGTGTMSARRRRDFTADACQAYHGTYGGGDALWRLHCTPDGPGAAAAATTAAQLPPLGTVRGRPFGETVAYVGIICTIQVVKALLYSSTVT
jgi:hypothetical protein